MKMMMRLCLALLLAIIGSATIQLVQSKAETMLWRVKSVYPYRVQVEFYSENRKHEWPGGGNAWGLDNNRTQRFSLICNAGEKICLGAWVTGNAAKYWGVGLHNSHSCRNCCYVCGGGEIPRQVLD
ncbi:MAG TPA: hypothetical protein VMH84_04115 [Xanthobacteraceae bacterium]|nr:hypothetical protein [Xanthobacteraceae bacterium]